MVTLKRIGKSTSDKRGYGGVSGALMGFLAAHLTLTQSMLA